MDKIGPSRAIFDRDVPRVVFAFRFGNEDGFVQQFFAKQRDLVARELHGQAESIFAFKQVGKNPVFVPSWSREIELDLYDYSETNKIRIKDFIQGQGVALIIFQGANFGEVDLRFLRTLGVRSINTEDHSFDHGRTQPFLVTAAKIFERRLLRRNIHDLHVTNSHGQYDFFHHFACISRSRLRAVPHGIDTDYFRPGDRSSACADLGLDPKTIWVMSAAQARPEKRVDLIMEAVRRAKSERPSTPIGFFYVGAGLFLEEWERVATLIFGNHVDFRFFGKQTDMRMFYHAASIFAHGSVRESFGLVMAEAMSSGLPVVATRTHGSAELVLDGSTGYLVQSNDWDGFATALGRYLDNNELRNIHGNMGRRRCVEYYTSSRESADLASLILPLLAKDAPRNRRVPPIEARGGLPQKKT